MAECSSKKRAYARRRYAVRALKRLQSEMAAGTKHVRSVYQCRECGAYHLTSRQPKKGSR